MAPTPGTVLRSWHTSSLSARCSSALVALVICSVSTSMTTYALPANPGRGAPSRAAAAMIAAAGGA